MAKLLTYFDLCSISDHREFLGVSEDGESGTVINTLGRNIFLLIQLSNQQQVHSWNVLEKLTNKVVYDFKNKKYVAVFFNRFFRLWDSSVTDVNKVKKLKIPKLVHDLVSIQRKDTIVLYKDGSCESLELCLETRKTDKSTIASSRPIFNAADHTIVGNVTPFWPTNDSTSASPMLTYFVTNNAASGTVDLVYYKLDAETLTPSGAAHRLRIARPNNEAALIGAVVVDSDSQPPNLMTLWSDKRIFMMPLRFDESANQSNVPGYFVAMLNLFKVDQPLTIHAVGKDCVAIYGANEQQEGASLVLYNTRFNVAQSKQFFKVYFNNARIWVMGKYILLAYGQTLACVSYRIAKEQLADMVGSQRSKTALTTSVIDKDSINEESSLEEAITFDAERQAVANAERIDNLASIEAASKVQPNVAQKAEIAERIQQDLNSLYAHGVLLDINRGDIFLSDTVQSQIGANVRDSCFVEDEVLLLAAELEKVGASEVEITERIVPLLIQTKRPDELVRCLRKYANISDKMLVRTLKFFLNLSTGEATANGVQNGDVGVASTVRRQQLHIDATKARYVNVVLSCSFAADQLIGSLRSELDFSEVLCVLKHITGLLDDANCGLEEMIQFGDAFNEDLQLLAWFGVIVDAHYQQFVLSRNAEVLGLLTKWRDYINDQIDSVRGMKSLSAELYNLVNGKTLATDKQSSKWYSVEVIKLY